MDYERAFRRAFHMCAPLFLLYYLIPGEVWLIGVRKELCLLVLLLLLLVSEAVRLHSGRTFFGLREYEGRQLSAYTWAGIGMTMALILFPMAFVICAVVGMGWTDPLIGELRQKWKKAYPALPILVYFTITISCLRIFSDISLWSQFFLAGIATAVALLSERPALKYVDDDFLMLMVPLLVMTGVYEYLCFTGLA
jgi:dolichol kinase